jgi:uncharacterized low-complexity protein
MKNRMMMLWVFLAASMLTSPATAAPPEEDKAATEEKADEAKTDDVKADEEKADEAKAGDGETGGEAKADTEAKADEPAEIETDEEAFDVVAQLVDAAKGGQWSLVAAFVVMLLVYVVKRFGLKDKLPSKAVPWVAAGCSMAGYVAAALMVEGAAVGEALIGGMATGAAAVGLWEMLFKHFLGKKSEAPAES